MAIKARIFWDIPSGAYVVISAYNEKLVDALKTLIPSGDRSFDPQTKHWFVKEQYGEFLRSMAVSAFGVHAVSFTSKTVAEQSAQAQQSSWRPPLQTSGGTTESAVLEFFAMLSYDDAKTSYRRAALTVHPDKQGGDAAKMARLNELWSRLEKEYYKR
jgi:hypothetical protein